jgi:hypothetical protein
MAAFLENILLGDDGNIRPQYGEQAGPGRNLSVGEVNSTGGFTVSPQQQEDRASDKIHDQWRDDLAESSHDIPEQYTRALNPKKRKLDQTNSENWFFALEDLDLSQHLPDQSVLIKVAQFFCVSFHHWVPYVHKQRLQRRVSEGLRDAGIDLFLHALVAVSLRHMDSNTLFLDQNEIQQQIATSRSLVEIKSIRHVSIESLQALIIIVFDHVSIHHLKSPIMLIFWRLRILIHTLYKLKLTNDSLTMENLKELGL